jgi:SAM-dependent methyltransferase
MHDTAFAFGRAFFEGYVTEPGARILDVGAQDINGSLRGCAPASARYLGVDMAAGPGVDLVLDDPYSLPFGDGEFDAVVSTSCFEHDPMFWLSFLEIVRVTRPGGHVYANTPSNGWVHCHPLDCWRFYPDSGLALQAWARRQGYDLTLVESFIGRRTGNVWNDAVMVFRRGPGGAACRRISDLLPGAMNLRVAADEPVRNPQMASEDQQIIQHLLKELSVRDETIAALRDGLAAMATLDTEPVAVPVD